MRNLKYVFIICIACWARCLFGQDDQSLSPYFQIISENSSTESLPLQSTKADVQIIGTIADVTVAQTYQNRGNSTIEAIYVFPGSTKSAVYDMEMQVGNRTIRAKIEEKQKARKDYEQAKSEGKRASLLEQKRPNVFQMNVSNVLPGDEVKVTLKYTENLVPEAGVYSFVYPTVVGPRYGGDASENDTHVNMPYLKSGKGHPSSFELNTTVRAPMPLQTVTSSSHKIDKKYTGTNEVAVHISDTESSPNNRDFVLNYQLAGKAVESGLMLYEHGDENFFMLTVQPPKVVEAKSITDREYIFVIDVSGSMRGFPLDVTKVLFRNLMAGLKSHEKFNVVLFAGTSALMNHESLDVTPENIEAAIAFMDAQRGGGGTELRQALNTAISIPKCGQEETARSIVVVTDGYISAEADVFDLIRDNADQSNFFSFGIGSGINRHLVEGIAQAGNGEPLVVLKEEGAAAKAEAFRQYINAPVLTHVKANFGGLDVYDVEPKSISDVLAERPVVITGKYRGNISGKSITLSGYMANGKKYKKRFEMDAVIPMKEHNAIRYLWARQKIGRIDDFATRRNESEEKKQAIVDLGLKYNLLTRHTSFIAIEDEPVASVDGDFKTVKQVSPLPQGVSNSAIGFDLSIKKVTRRSAVQKVAVNISALRAVPNSNMDAAMQQELMALVKQSSAKIKAQLPLTLKSITLDIHIDANGKVVKVNLENTILSSEAKKQISKLIKEWTFKQGASQIIKVPLTIKV